MRSRTGRARIAAQSTAFVAFTFAVVALIPGKAGATPDIASQTGKSCATCHIGGAGTNGTLNSTGRSYQQCGKLNCNSATPSQPVTPPQNRTQFPSTFPQNPPTPQPQNPFFPGPSQQPPAYQPYAPPNQQPQPYYQPPVYQAPSYQPYQPQPYQPQPYYQQPYSPYSQPALPPSSAQPYQNSPTPWR